MALRAEIDLGTVLCASSPREMQVGSHSAVGMAKVAAGGDAVADEAFEFFDLGEARFGLARPDGLAGGTDFENAAGAGDERHAAELLLEGEEQLLGHPGGAH